MSSHWLYLREHHLFDFASEANYTCGIYQIKNDTLRFEYFNQDPVLNFDYGIINRQEGVIYLFKFNQNQLDSLKLEIKSNGIHK